MLKTDDGLSERAEADQRVARAAHMPGALRSAAKPGPESSESRPVAMPQDGHAPGGLEWVTVPPGASYFATELGQPWTPIGHNDAITWPELAGLFRRRDLNAVEAHFRWLAEHGVTCVRLMLEYAQVRHRYFERPIGRFVPAMVQLWDDLFAICERTGVRILLTPFDTFWMWLHWKHHPYNRRNGGVLGRRARLLLCSETRAAMKARLAFAIDRWSGSGALFGWDLWNEIHPGHAEESADCFGEFIHDLSTFVGERERERFGRCHPQTVSLFGPELTWRPHMALAEPIFRHPDLDFASIHIYEQGTIDDPRDTVWPALGMGRIVADALSEIRDGRPFFDSEHGPIHRFKDHKKTLPAAFDDEYFRHMQWAHLASGGAGGGMRWPNRNPHILTPGMRAAQRSLAGFVGLVDWTRFRRLNLNRDVRLETRGVACCACGDRDQALLWLVRTDTIGPEGRVRPEASPTPVRLTVPGLGNGTFHAVLWDTLDGRVLGQETAVASVGALTLNAPVRTDLAIAVRRGAPTGE